MIKCSIYIVNKSVSDMEINKFISIKGCKINCTEKPSVTRSKSKLYSPILNNVTNKILLE